jgi:alpha-1,6-mannosyltransferase
VSVDGLDRPPEPRLSSTGQKTGTLQPPRTARIGTGARWPVFPRSSPREAGEQERSRATTVLAVLLGLALVLTTAWIVADGAVGASPVLPYSPYFTGWLRHITGHRLTYTVFLGNLLAFTAAYAALLPLARRLPTRAIVALIAVVYTLVFIGPILLSTDVFSYIAYARMGVVHGLNPYTTAPWDASHDAIYRYVGTDWIHASTAYGPLYTLVSYPFALFGVVGAIWGMKVVAVAACVCMLWLTWRCATRRGLDPKLALVVVGLNPLVVIYSLASAHNDFLMVALMMAAVYLTITSPDPAAATAGEHPRGSTRWWGIGSGREAWAGAAIVAGTLVKATVATMLPFLILSRRRLSPVLGALAALFVGLLVAYLAFGVHGMDIVAALNRNSAFVSTDSFATQLAHLLGKPGVYPADHMILRAMLIVIGAYLLWRTWRGYDWVAASGWALLAITVTSTWLLAWYLIWPLPLAAVSRDRRLLWATLAIQALFIVHQISPLFTTEQ